MSFERLFGVKVEAFERIVDRLRPLWEKQVLGANVPVERSSSL